MPALFLTSAARAQPPLAARASGRLLALVIAFCLASGSAFPALAAPAGQAGTGDRFSELAIGSARSTPGAAATPAGAAGPSVTRVAVSLGVVVVLICGLGWTWKRLFAAQQQKAGGGVSLVSRAILTPRHQVLILRTGHRLLIVGDSGQGMNLLCDVSEPAEIAAILGEAAGESAFPSVLQEAVDEFEPTAPGSDGEALDQAPAAMAQEEVRSLIERVRTLAGGQTKTSASHSP